MIKKTIFSIFFFTGIIIISLIFLPTLFLPQKIVLIGGKVMGIWASFCLKFFVILLLTWILNRVMPLLDKPRKRVLFVFFLGTIFALYNEVDLFWSDVNYAWSIFVICAESFNWLLTAYILSKFIRPKHLGAL